MNTCKHENTYIVLTPQFIHHAKEVCTDCGRFIKWVSADELSRRTDEIVKPEDIKQMRLL